MLKETSSIIIAKEVSLNGKTHELIRCATLAQIFGSAFGAHLKDGANRNDTRSFVEMYRKEFRELCVSNEEEIRRNAYNIRNKQTFLQLVHFLFEDSVGNFFVGRIYVNTCDELGYAVYSIEEDKIFHSDGTNLFII